MKKIRLWLTGVVVAVAVAFICAGCNDSGGAGNEAAVFLNSLYWGAEDGDGGGSYDTVTIGRKIWMTKNMDLWIENSWWRENSWCYDNSEDNCSTYGRLYTWEAAKKACQLVVGWRLPSNNEWADLVSAAGAGFEEDAGNKLKSESYWRKYESQDGNGTDDFGFSALPGGSRNSDGTFDDNEGYQGYWWTATEKDGEAYYRNIHYDNGNVNEHITPNKNHGYSVRCVKG